VAEQINSEIIKLMKKDNLEWKSNFKAVGIANGVSKRNYNGVNAFLLMLISKSRKYQSPYWLTYNQIREAGGYVKKDPERNKHCNILFFNNNVLPKKVKKQIQEEMGLLIKNNPDISEEKYEEIYEEKHKARLKESGYMVIRKFSVFNVDETEEIADKFPPPEVEITPIPKIEVFIKNLGINITSSAVSTPCYNFTNDTIDMPPKYAAEDTNAYYATIFHELIHATAAKDRLDREANKINSHSYEEMSKIRAKEELIAELGALYLCNHFGLADEKMQENHAGYLKSWIEALDNDHNYFVSASSKATKAANYILEKALDLNIELDKAQVAVNPTKEKADTDKELETTELSM